MQKLVVDPPLVLPQLVGQVGAENLNIDIGCDPGGQARAADEHQPGKGRENGQQQPEGGPDRREQQREGQVPHGHQQGVLEVFIERAGEFGLHREDVEQHHPAGDKEQGAARQHDRPGGAAPGEAEIHVQPQHHAHRHDDEPVNGGLAEVLLEGIAEIGGDLSLVGADALHHGVVERRGGGPDRDQRQAVDEPEEVQDHHVGNKIQSAPQRAIHRKQGHFPLLFIGFHYFVITHIIPGMRAVVDSEN